MESEGDQSCRGAVGVIGGLVDCGSDTWWTWEIEEVEEGEVNY